VSADVVVGDARTFQLSIRGELVARAVEQAPRVAYKWLRDFLGASFGKHRKVWLQQKAVKFGRGKNKQHGIIVPQVNAGGDRAPKHNEVLYIVRPAARTMPTPAAARSAVRQLEASASTGNEVLGIHETGGILRAKGGGWMAIPVRTKVKGGQATPERWRAAHPKKTLRMVPSKRADELLLYEWSPRQDVVGRRGQLRFVLVRQVKMLPKLRYYATWDALRSDRDAKWAQTAAHLEEDLASGVNS